tara:strand:- start:58 stop:1176 length:1119 start_codon:yes stop_codon:yes gene_type:complete
MAIDKVTSAALETSTNQPNFRNIIINGDMSLAQRATSVTSISSGNTIHTCDRWKTYASSAGTWTQTQEALTTGDPYTNGFATSLKLDCTTANGSLSSGSYLSVAQSIEAQNLQYIKKGTSNAEQLTASFWVKSTKTGTNIVQFVSLDDTVRICAKSYTISSSDTWEKKTITIPADTSSTGNISNDNGEGLRMIFWVVAGTDYTSGALATTWADSANANRAVGQVNNADSTSNNFEITGVQLEVGTAASDFEFLPYDVNLERCQRYYQLWTEGNNKEVDTAFHYTSSSIRWVSSFYKQMRTLPSLVTVSGTDYYGFYSNSTFDTFNDFGGINDTSTNQNFQVYISSGVSGTAGHAGMLRTNNASASIAFSAEL